MCGIIGRVQFNKNKDFPDLSLRYLKNRGPDGERFFKDAVVALGHARLAVIDEEETSDQPIISNGISLIANGEIYNHKELRRRGDYSYSGTSDCEAIIHVYKKSGIEGFKDLDGFYAFALYDEEAGKVILHKDSVGKKPLYVLEDKDEILFASTVAALSDNRKKKLTINLPQIDFYMKNGFIFPKETIFREIIPVLPGEIYEVDVNSKSVKKYFLKKECKPGIAGNNAVIEEDIERLIDRAVSKRVSGLNKPVLLFSGGIDSTVIASYMLKHNPRTRLVSIKQPLWFLHDEPYVREAARLFKVPVHFVNILTPGFYGDLEKFIECLDQPLSVYGYYYLSALSLKAKEYGKVLVTGDGGDEVFWGYGSLGEWFDPSGPVRAPDILVGPPPGIPLSPYGLKTISTGFIGPDFVKLDKATAEHQMEARCPYLDWDLMCYARNAPLRFWLSRNETKHPLKQILRRQGFRSSFIKRRKIGFSYPFRTLMMPKYGYMIRSLRSSRDLFYYLGIEKESLPQPSFFDVHRRFDYFWRLFVLGRFANALRASFTV